MKELSIEEKAQVYDEAIERARKLKENPQSVFNEYSPKEGDTICDYIFPELKEESEDEKVRKELIDIVAKSPITFAFEDKNKVLAWLQKQGERKTWSEEDKEHIHSLLDRLEGMCKKGATFTATRFAVNQDMDWLKSIKNRVLPQPKQEWSEEDEVMIKVFDSIIRYIVEVVDKDVLERFGTNHEELFFWLKSLKPQKCLIPSEEEIEKAAQEWDSKANFSPFYMTPTGVKQDITTHKESFKAGLNWILKFLRPQNSWKPSDEQMVVLELASKYERVFTPKQISVLIDLKEQLKKLKGE